MVTTEKRKTFKFQMALACALFGLFLLVWFGLFNYYQASEMFKNNTLRYLDDIVARVAADLDEHILLRKQLLDKAAAEVSASELGNLSAHAFEVIERLKPLATLFNTFVVYDKNGQLLAATPGAEERLAKNLTDQVDLRLVKYQKQPQVSTSFISQKGTSLIFITVPLLAPHGKLVGWLGGILDLSTANLFRHLARQMAGEVGYIKVTALESNITLFQTQMSQLPASLSSLRGEESGGDIVASAPAPGNGDNLFSDNANMLTVQRPLTQAGWMVGAWLPKDEANQKFGRMTKNYFIFGILSILFIIPLCVWWIKRALSPLEVLKTQMETLKTEPQTELLPISEYQELQSVADVINRIWSEQRAVEARLIQREAFFRAINDASPFGLFVIAEDGVIDYINDACKRLGGKEGGEWLGRYWLDAVHPDDRARLRQLGREVFAGYRDHVLTRCRISDTSAATCIRVEVRLVRVISENTSCYLGIITDVTEQEATRAALSTERERATVILGSIGDAVVLTNDLDEVEYLNPPAELLLGKKASEVLGRPFHTLVTFSLPENGLPVTMAHLETLAGQGQRELDMAVSDADAHSVVLTLSVITAQDNMQGYRVYVLRDDSARRERERAHRWEANHDALTGLLNRRGYLSALSSLLSSPSRGNGSHAVVLMDLDHFKNVNDVAGHLVGDHLLQDVANIIQSRLRSTDVAARLGGDEFAMLLYKCSLQDAMVLLEEVRSQLENHKIVEGSRALGVTGSFGLTLVQPEDNVPSDLIERADSACYCAKHGGRNRIVSC